MAKMTLGDVATYVNGRAFKPAEWESIGRPIIRIQNLTNSSKEINRTTKTFEEKYIVYDGDLLFAWSASLGAHIWHGEEAWLNQHIFKVIPEEKIIDKMYLYYYLLYVVDSLYAKTHGSGMVHITLKPFKATEIYVPSLPQQQRIVERIESLFAQLDEAKEKAQAALDSFEPRKAAILHKAFTGELVRKAHIQMVPLEKITTNIRIGPFGSALHKNDYITDGIPVINPKHIINQKIIPEVKTTISKQKADELASYILEKNDIVLGRRGDMGRSAPVTNAEAGWLCGTGSMIIRLKDGYNAQFYSQIIASHASVQYLEEHSVGSTMKNLNEKIVRSLPIPDFEVKEQQEIVRIVDSLLAKEQQAKEAAEAVLEQIDLVKKSILSRAFRGELGTNDPTEESAVELLKEIL